MTEASSCTYTLICPLTGPATNHCPGNGLGYLRLVERPNVHIISLQLIIHYYACERRLIATEPSIGFQHEWVLLRVSGELAISLSSVVCYLHDLGKSIQSCWIMLHMTKILQNKFWEKSSFQNMFGLLIKFFLAVIKHFLLAHRLPRNIKI